MPKMRPCQHSTPLLSRLSLQEVGCPSTGLHTVEKDILGVVCQLVLVSYSPETSTYSLAGVRPCNKVVGVRLAGQHHLKDAIIFLVMVSVEVYRVGHWRLVHKVEDYSVAFSGLYPGARYRAVVGPCWYPTPGAISTVVFSATNMYSIVFGPEIVFCTLDSGSSAYSDEFMATYPPSPVSTIDAVNAATSIVEILFFMQGYWNCFHI